MPIISEVSELKSVPCFCGDMHSCHSELFRRLVTSGSVEMTVFYAGVSRALPTPVLKWPFQPQSSHLSSELLRGEDSASL